MTAQGPGRLPAPAGSRIDRTRQVTFRFEGRRYIGYAGDTIASALAANGVRVLSRSFKYRRPRGILTLSGQDANTLVQLPGRPNVLADREPIVEGLDVFGQNYEGSLERDRGAWVGWFHRFLPVGFYYKAFFRPRGAWRFWAPFIRRKAGLGRIDTSAPHGYYDKAYAFADVAVIGGGPAGMSAALAAARAGADVVLIDENPVLGGSLTHARFDGDVAAADRMRDRLVADVAAEARISVLTDAIANGWFADNMLAIVRGNRLIKLRASKVVLASGSVEQPPIFRNNDLPGIMFADAAQRLIRHYGVRPGTRAVVALAHDDGYGAVLDLVDAGIDVAAAIDFRGSPVPTPRAEAVRAAGVRVLTGTAIVEAGHDHEGRHLGAVLVGPIGDDGTCAGAERIECDLLCLAIGRSPAGQLACHAGAMLAYDETAAAFSVENLPPGGHVAGAVAGWHRIADALADGALAGWTAAASAGFTAGAAPTPPSRDGDPDRPGFAWPIFPHPDGKDFIDFDEDLQVDDIRNACADGYEDTELVKRYSTVGMGPSQGRHSALNMVRLVARLRGESLAAIRPTTVRPPLGPETFGVLAGRSFDPVRHTAMHRRHLDAGAQMMVAGPWMRPAYYGAPAGRSAAIAAEVAAVRRGVGVLDVSTLGGIEVRGPDAAEFLNRMYTYAYARQPVGRSRYVLMCDEAGVIVDDGVACRLHERHFYVTATSGGAPAVYRSMLFWNAQWRLNVDVSDVTNAWAAVSLAGPSARKVLAALTDDIDVGGSAFPYMDVRTGTVAGIQARVLRIGFVGELGYEIHVPTSQGEALWDALAEAGRPHGIRPFGIEAQRVLRLEKGHIIIGQDTDGLTYPAEAGMEWAISRRKPFYVGGRSNAINESRPLTRKLVGFTIHDPRAPMPEECHLTLRGNDIAGRVTSVAWSEAVGAVIGLAYVAPEQSAVGTRFPIKVGPSRFVDAEVVPLPFYDPEGHRQEVA